MLSRCKLPPPSLRIPVIRPSFATPTIILQLNNCNGYIWMKDQHSRSRQYKKYTVHWQSFSRRCLTWPRHWSMHCTGPYSCRLNYCNVLSYDIADGQLQWMQSVKNAAAWLVTGTWRSEHITLILKSLHWLPVLQCITFKLAMFVHNCPNGCALVYLADNCQTRSAITACWICCECQPHLTIECLVSLGCVYETVCLLPFAIHHCLTWYFQDFLKHITSVCMIAHKWLVNWHLVNVLTN